MHDWKAEAVELLEELLAMEEGVSPTEIPSVQAHDLLVKTHLEVYGGGEGSGDELAEMAAQEFATEELSGFLKFLARHHSNRFSVGAPPDHQIVLRSRAPDLTVEEKARREREMKSVVNAVRKTSADSREGVYRSGGVDPRA